jgi:enoyl-[acyl-carrier protein] reductase I
MFGRWQEALDCPIVMPCDLHGRVVDCSRDGFLMAMDVSCHSFVQMVRLAEPLMNDGGALLTITFFGSEKVVEDYNLMGPVKAKLEGTVRYMAAELGPKNIRVNSLSPDLIMTRAASGIDRFNEFLDRDVHRVPNRHLVTIDEVGATAAFLAGDGARAITGGVHYIDGGYNIVG